MTDEAALLKAVRAKPADDTPRHVYADWLDENDAVVDCPECGGDCGYWDDGGHKYQKAAWVDCGRCRGGGTVNNGFAARAEFVRAQIALANTNPAVLELVDSMPNRAWEAAEFAEAAALRRREGELLKAHAAAWLAPSPTPFPVVVMGAEQVGWGLREQTRLGDTYIPVTFVRGFPGAVIVPSIQSWLGGECGRCGGEEVETPGCSACSGDGRTPGIGPAVVRAHPVERVVVADRKPIHFPFDPRPGWTYLSVAVMAGYEGRPTGWHRTHLNEASIIPHEVRAKMQSDPWDTPEQAVADFSTTLIRLAAKCLACEGKGKRSPMLNGMGAPITGTGGPCAACAGTGDVRGIK